jgi:hypothetical protein
MLDIIRVIKSRRMRWAEHVVCVGEKRDACRILVRNPEGKTTQGRHRHRWECKIKVDLKEMECEGVDWTHLAQDRNLWWALINMVMNLQVR